jgi:hypothetical protein
VLARAAAGVKPGNSFANSASKPAAATTTRRKRAVFANALGYAVELRLLTANPLDRVRWTASAVAETVDRRSVTSPAQARALLKPSGNKDCAASTWKRSSAACTMRRSARPRRSRCVKATAPCPSAGGDRIDLAASQPRAGTEWTDDGARREERGLEHRAANEIRSILIPPVQVRMLRAHLARYGTGPSGRLEPFRQRVLAATSDNHGIRPYSYNRNSSLSPSRAVSSGTAKKRSATGRAPSGTSWAVCPYFHCRAMYSL